MNRLCGTLIFRENQVYIQNGGIEFNLFVWLACLGLRNKDIEIEYTKDANRMLIGEVGND